MRQENQGYPSEEKSCLSRWKQQVLYFLQFSLNNSFLFCSVKAAMQLPLTFQSTLAKSLIPKCFCHCLMYLLFGLSDPADMTQLLDPGRVYEANENGKYKLSIKKEKRPLFQEKNCLFCVLQDKCFSFLSKTFFNRTFFS